MCDPNLVHACSDVVDEVVLLVVDLDAATSRLASRLDYPSILGSIEAKLEASHDLLNFVQDRVDLLSGILALQILEIWVSLDDSHVPWTPGEINVVLVVKHAVIDVIAYDV